MASRPTHARFYFSISRLNAVAYGSLLPVVLALKSCCSHIYDTQSSALSRLTEPCCLLSSVNLDKQTAKGSTALHYCCLTDNSECLKLLLRGKASIDIGKKPSAECVISAASFSFPSSSL